MTTETRVCIQTRFNEEMVAEIEAWRRKQPRIPPMTAAIRRLVEEGLKAVARNTNSRR